VLLMVQLDSQRTCRVIGYSQKEYWLPRKLEGTGPSIILIIKSQTVALLDMIRWKSG